MRAMARVEACPERTTMRQAVRSVFLLLWLCAGCRGAEPPPAAQAEPVPASAAAASSAAPAADGSDGPSVQLGIRGFAVTVYEKPSDTSARVGYLRVGARVPRSPEPATTRGCKGGWYAIEPRGFVCAGVEATTDMNDPLLRASARRPRLDAPLPYRYGFVRAVTPLYLRVPTASQQFKSEFKLEDHLEWFKEHKDEVQKTTLGAADVPVDDLGRVLSGKRVGELGERKSSTELSVGELFGGEGDDDPVPFWLRGDERLLPNISGFDVPEFAVFADRARRHTGLAFIGSFATDDHHLRRRFAVTTDLRLTPTSKVKPDAASDWHGVELGGELTLPLALVAKRGARVYAIEGGHAIAGAELTRRSVHRLSGKMAKADGEKYVQLADGRWADDRDLGVALRPAKFPSIASKGGKWIEINVTEQTLVLWEGDTPVYATLVSTGRPAIGDWNETTSSPRGSFKIFSKHVSATMDSDEGASERLAAKGSGEVKRPGDEGYVPTKGDGTYGVNVRRGHGLFKLRDVPHIQYFHENYAIHGAYWHDVFGIPRSHGCINLAPTDSLRMFHWTEPKLPEHWHAVNGEGTTVIIHK